MKKVMLAVAAAATCAAMANEISSQNIVGYSQIELTSKNTIVGINYLGTGGTAMSLNDAVPYVDGMTKGNSINTADQIQIQTPSGGYTVYYMSNGKNAKGTGDVAGLEGKWAKGGTYTPTTDTVSAGQAFWYVRQNYTGGDPALTITVAGEVCTLASSSKDITLQYTHIANPYPADLQLNDGIPYVSGMTQGNSINTADQIQIQTSTGGYSVYYMSNGKNAKGTGDVAGLAGKWAKGGTYVPTEDAIPAGKGAWFCRKGSADFQITVARPFDL